MVFWYDLVTGLFLAGLAYVLGQRKGSFLWKSAFPTTPTSSSLSPSLPIRPHSTPSYHGAFLACCVVLCFVFFLSLSRLLEEKGLLSWGGARVLEGGGGVLPLALGYSFLSFSFQARLWWERCVFAALILAASVAVLTTFSIVLSVSFETLRFFSYISPVDFLFGLEWSPQMALRPDQVGSSGAFGMIPLLLGTFLIVVIAMMVAGPIGLFCAIYFSEYASPAFRAIGKPLLEILAGIPTVVFGFFAAVVVAPSLRFYGEALGLEVNAQSALSAGLVMGIMIIPFISSLSDDILHAVPQSLRDASYAMGATQSETIRAVVLPAALPGIVSAFILAISRAVGETMIVVMAAGMSAHLTLNPLQSVTTVTVQIKSLLVGDQEFDSPKTLAAFALGFVLFFITLMLNLLALKVVKRYREIYE